MQNNMMPDGMMDHKQELEFEETQEQRRETNARRK